MLRFLLLFFSLALFLSNAIEISFNQVYYKAINSINIPSCKYEPCILNKGNSLIAVVNFQAKFASSYDDIREISNVGILVGVPYYQQSMLYALGGHTNLCERRLFTCPLVLGQNYTVPVTISLPNDNTKVDELYKVVWTITGTNSTGHGCVLAKADTFFRFEEPVL